MDKNAIKKYAVWARNELIARVAQKAMQYDITKENIIDDEILSKIYMFINDNKKLFIEHVDSNWESFLKCFSSSFSCENLDDFDVDIIESSLPGFHCDYASILMIGKNKEIWGAYFDTPEMYYFTTDKEKLNSLS